MTIVKKIGEILANQFRGLRPKQLIAVRMDSGDTASNQKVINEILGILVFLPSGKNSNVIWRHPSPRRKSLHYNLCIQVNLPIYSFLQNVLIFKSFNSGALPTLITWACIYLLLKKTKQKNLKT